jgi:cell division protein FtsZ
MPIPGETLVVAVVLVLAVVLGARLLAILPGWLRRRRRPEARAIRVIGVGGGGSNAVDRMVEARLGSVSFVACNTDAQALRASRAGTKIRIGDAITHGLGAGGDPEVGRRSAEENEELIARSVAGADLVFVTAGLGGGTGSGGAPVIAAIARDQGALTIAVVTKPFGFEGARRERVAREAAAELLANVDALIVVPNDRVSDVLAEDASLIDAFSAVDDVLLQAVQGIIDLVATPGLINLDFADVSAIMKDAGPALIGIGRGSGPNRAIDAAREAIDSPLDEASVEGASGILFNVSGPPDLRLREVRLAADEIRARADLDANVICGAAFRRPADAELLITLVATGLTGQKVAPARGRERTADRPPVAVPVEGTGNGRPSRRRPPSTVPVEPGARPEAFRGAAREASRGPGPEGLRSARPEARRGPVPVEETSESDVVGASHSTREPTLNERKLDEREHNERELNERELDVPSFLRRRTPSG